MQQQTQRDVPALLTVAEVAAQLRVEQSTVYRWLKRGTLPAVRFAGSVRVRADALDGFIREGSQA